MPALILLCCSWQRLIKKDKHIKSARMHGQRSTASSRLLAGYEDPEHKGIQFTSAESEALAADEQYELVSLCLAAQPAFGSGF